MAKQNLIRNTFLSVSLFHVSDGGLLVVDLSGQRVNSTLPARIPELLHTDLLLEAFCLLLCKLDGGIVFSHRKEDVVVCYSIRSDWL